MFLLGEAARDKEAAKAVQCSLEYTTLRRVTQVGWGGGCWGYSGPPEARFSVPASSPVMRHTHVSASRFPSQPAHHLAPSLSLSPSLPPQATEIYYDPDPKTTIIEEDREWVEGYFDLNEGAQGGRKRGQWAETLACLLARPAGHHLPWRAQQACHQPAPPAAPPQATWT